MITTLAAAILFSAAPRGNLDTKADFKYPVMALSVLAQDLSARAKVPIRVTPDVGEFGVYVNVRERSVREVLDLVAKATTSEWVEANGGITIRRTPVQRNAEAKRFFDYRLAQGRENLAVRPAPEVSIDAMVRAIKEAAEVQAKLKQSYTPALYTQLGRLDAYAPAEIVGRELLDTLGIEALLKLEPNERVVYSSHPTRLQRAMPVSMRGVVGRYQGLLDLHRQALDQAQISNDPRGGGYFSGLLGSGRMPGRASSEVPQVAVVHIVITQSRHLLMGQQVVVTAFDNEGRAVDNKSFRSPLMEEPSEGGEAGSARDWGGLAKLSDEAAAINVLLQNLQRGALTEPERRKILTLMAEGKLARNRETPVSAALDVWVERNGALVMECPSVSYPASAAEFPPGERLDFVLSPFTTELKSENAVTIGRARTNQYRGAGWSFDKPAAVIAKALLEKGALGLEDLADLAATTSDDESFAGVLMMLPALSGGSPAPYLYDGVFPLRVYGLLSASDRKRVREAGLQWELGGIPKPIRTLVELEIANGRISPGRLGSSGDIDSATRSHANRDKPQLTSYEREPTVLMTLEKAKPMVFGLSFTKSPRILMRMRQGGSDNYHFRLPAQVGEDLAMRELAARQGVRYGGDVELAFAEVTKGELTAQFEFGPFPEAKVIFPVIQEKNYSFGPVTILSKETQAAVDAAYKQTLEERKNTLFGGGSSGPPPPPR